MRQTTQGVDGRWSGPPGTVLIEVRKTNSARDVRSGLVELALALQEEPGSTEAVCVVVSQKLSEKRVRHEVEQFRSIARPDLAPRMHYLVSTDELGLQGDFQMRDSGLRDYIDQVVEREARQSPRSVLPARQAVISALMTDHMLGGGEARPLTHWQRVAEVSYPTALAAVNDLTRMGLIEDTKDRRVRLRSLSASEVIDLAKAHAAKRRVALFWDPTGFATPKKLFSRVFSLRAEGAFGASVRVGGVLGATQLFPQLDITGAPRLDLSTTGEHLDVEAIDAALVPLAHHVPQGSAVLAVHFTADVSASVGQGTDAETEWASAFECLADLVEMGYVREAHDMAESLLNTTVSNAPARNGRKSGP